MATKKRQTVAETLAERGKTHGDFVEFSEVAQGLKDVMHASPNWDGLPAGMKEALEMIAHKMARVLTGDPTHADHWHDIAGYSGCVETRL